ncbi:MAG: NADH-quinone oxidoreductase subunit H [Gallionellaceae bacterium]|nr:NADH-quinone oxidoreductase subunit H [Gallionellaceae bacterium]
MMHILIELAVMPLVAFTIGMFMVLMMRKIAAKIQRRVGPPLLQPLYDIVKLYAKKTQSSHGLLHDIGIVMAVGGYIAAETMLPVPGMNGIADKAGLLTLAYVTMIPSLGLALGVGQCANPNGSIGIARALTAMLAYDIPFVVIIFGASWFYGSNNLIEVIAAQQAGGIASWGVTKMPLLAIAGLFTLYAMLGKQPFEIYVAPAEIATGPMVEMGGKHLGGLFVMQCFQLFTASAVYVSMFLGGGENWLFFILKLFAVVAIPMSMAFVFPRYRTEDVLAVVWRWPMVLGLAGVWLVMH